MEYFLKAAKLNDDYNRLCSYLESHPELPAMVTGATHIQKAHFISALINESFAKPTLVIADTEGAAQKLCQDINSFVGKQMALLYPAKELVIGDYEAASREYEHRRIHALTALLNGECSVVICSPDAAAQLTIPPDELKERTININTDAEISQDQLVEKLLAAGYYRCDMIEGCAQFSVRGGIVDVFPPNAAMPYRIEFWGDCVDSISVFDIQTQRRTDSLEKIQISPASETLFDNNDFLCEKLAELSKKQRGKNVAEVRERLADEITKIRSGIRLHSYDKYFSLCYNDEATIFDYISDVYICENTAVRERYRGISSQHIEDLKILLESHHICRGLDRFMLSKNEFNDMLEARASVYFDTMLRGRDLKLGILIDCFGAIQMSPWSGEYKLLEDELANFMRNGYSCIIFAGTEKGAKTLADDLCDDGFSAIYMSEPTEPYAKKIIVTPGTISGGIEYSECRTVIITHTAVHSERKRVPKPKKAEEIRSLSDIAIGDLVVHYSHGIGIFEGVHKIETQGVSKDYIRIKYAGMDVLHVPVTQLDLVSRYIGTGDASTIKLNKLNSEQWHRSKTKAKAAARAMASELIALYSKRMKSMGFQFPEDDVMQDDFEAHFNYIETDSQLRCIDEIKADMMRGVPMERLLCGDVGFGKTEVALRAAFKCICGGKQCAILVPTTVLAWQHYQTAMKRMEGFPVTVMLLSRYKSPQEQKQILKDLSSGRIDLIIGTHRIIQNDIKFKDLGLVIIDEEQRFGVAHKDKFKEMFSGVDILTLSATPIPRTLNMAMSGIRDMSVIDEPPQDRQPIATYVLEHDLSVICQAINKELRRNGQVYYIHNRIGTIYSRAAELQEALPDARIGVAHGKMSEDELLDVWKRLLDGDIDILVCTTIIETGVDVPNVNTLIIENADYLGLAQLHQLRGRVGRTNKRAYAYFTFERGKVLSEIAQKRLEAIREFTQFGSGFRIAMRDLEIRGAGSILGESQSGHLANVGYDMYLQLLSEAVREEQGEVNVHKEECLVDVRIDAYIPESYVSNQAQRVDCYRKIAMICNEEDSVDVMDELIDRFGDPPKSVVGLIEVAKIRNMASQCNITEITQIDDTMYFYISKVDMQRIAGLTDKFSNRMSLETTKRARICIKLLKGDGSLAIMKDVVTAMFTVDKT